MGLGENTPFGHDGQEQEGERHDSEEAAARAAAEARQVGRLLAEATAVAGAVGFTRELAVALSEVDFAHLEGRDLMDATLAIESLQRTLDVQKARTIGELDRTDVTYATVGLATKTWKANRTHNSPGSVARELTIAKTLRRFDAFDRALSEGRISVEHVAALANASNPRVIEALVELQDQLVDFASRNRFHHYVAYLRSLISLIDEDGPEPDHGDTNTARMAADGTGNLHLVMDLTGADAITAQRTITDEADRQYRAAVSEHLATGIPVPEAPQLRARAITELLRRGAKANPASPKPAVEAIIAVNIDREGLPISVRSIDGEAIDPTTAAVLLCEAYFQPIVVDSSGSPLHLGRTVRLFTAAQRRALAVRDGGCIFPACDQPAASCTAHHFVPWSLGGLTDTDTGGLLCPRHHGLVHGHNPWTIEIMEISDLPRALREQHVHRAGLVGLEPETRVRIWHGPNGQLLLAQNAADHHGPALGRQRPAA